MGSRTKEYRIYKNPFGDWQIDNEGLSYSEFGHGNHIMQANTVDRNVKFQIELLSSMIIDCIKKIEIINISEDETTEEQGS